MLSVNDKSTAVQQPSYHWLINRQAAHKVKKHVKYSQIFVLVLQDNASGYVSLRDSKCYFYFPVYFPVFIEHRF